MQINNVTLRKFSHFLKIFPVLVVHRCFCLISVYEEVIKVLTNQASTIQYLIAGAFEDKIALLNEVKGELEVQIGALAQGLEVGTELAEGGVVHLAVERDVVLDLRAAVDAVQDVALQILVNGIVLLQAVQRDSVERQRIGDLLKTDGKFDNVRCM